MMLDHISSPRLSSLRVEQLKVKILLKRKSNIKSAIIINLSLLQSHCSIYNRLQNVINGVGKIDNGKVKFYLQKLEPGK